MLSLAMVDIGYALGHVYVVTGGVACHPHPDSPLYSTPPSELLALSRNRSMADHRYVLLSLTCIVAHGHTWWHTPDGDKIAVGLQRHGEWRVEGRQRRQAGQDVEERYGEVEGSRRVAIAVRTVLAVGSQAMSENREGEIRGRWAIRGGGRR